MVLSELIMQSIGRLTSFCLGKHIFVDKLFVVVDKKKVKTKMGITVLIYLGVLIYYNRRDLFFI